MKKVKHDSKYEDLYQKIILQENYKSKKEKNPSYSLRAFSRDLCLSAGALSRVMSGNRVLSTENAKKVASLLSLDRNKTKKFVENSIHVADEGIKPVSNFNKIDISKSPEIVIDWVYYAIIDLLKTTDSKSDVSWISKKLGIKPLKTKRALDKLIELKLIKIEDNNYIPVDAHLSAESDSKNNETLKVAQKKAMELAMEKQNSVDRLLREMRCTTMAMNMNRLPEIRDLLKKFLHDVTSLAEEGKTTEVYQLNVQLFPLTDVILPGSE